MFFKSPGFQKLEQGKEYNGVMVESFQDAAQVFANRLAKRQKGSSAIIDLDCKTNSSVIYRVNVVYSVGFGLDTEYIHISLT